MLVFIFNVLTLGIPTILLIVITFNLFEGRDIKSTEGEKKRLLEKIGVFGGIKARELAIATIVGVALAVLNYLALQLKAATLMLAWPMLAIVAGGHTALAWFCKSGISRLKELIPCALLAAMPWFTAKTLTGIATARWEDSAMVELVGVLPTIAVVAEWTFFVVVLIKRREKEKEKRG